MENLICLDSSPLIDYYRKKTKEKTFFYKLIRTYTGFVLPVTAHFRILRGGNLDQHAFWQNILNEKHFDDIEGLDLITPSSFLQ